MHGFLVCGWPDSLNAGRAAYPDRRAAIRPSRHCQSKGRNDHVESICYRPFIAVGILFLLSLVGAFAFAAAPVPAAGTDAELPMTRDLNGVPAHRSYPQAVRSRSCMGDPAKDKPRTFLQGAWQVDHPAPLAHPQRNAWCWCLQVNFTSPMTDRRRRFSGRGRMPTARRNGHTRLLCE